MHFDPLPGMKPEGFARSISTALVGPRPIGWISSLSGNGVHNLAPYSFFNMVTGDPPTVMFCPNGPHAADDGEKDTLRNVRETGEFVYNMVRYEQRETMNLTSAPVASSVSEFSVADVAWEPSVKVAPLRVAASPIHLECEVFEIVDLPTRTEYANTMVIGKVVHIHIDDRFVVDGIIDTAAIEPLARLGYMDYTAVSEIFSMPRPTSA